MYTKSTNGCNHRVYIHKTLLLCSGITWYSIIIHTLYICLSKPSTTKYTTTETKCHFTFLMTWSERKICSLMAASRSDLVFCMSVCLLLASATHALYVVSASAAYIIGSTVLTVYIMILPCECFWCHQPTGFDVHWQRLCNVLITLRHPWNVQLPYKITALRYFTLVFYYPSYTQKSDTHSEMLCQDDVIYPFHIMSNFAIKLLDQNACLHVSKLDFLSSSNHFWSLLQILVNIHELMYFIKMKWLPFWNIFTNYNCFYGGNLCVKSAYAGRRKTKTLCEASSSAFFFLSTLAARLLELLLWCRASDSVFWESSLAFSYSCCLVTYRDWAFRRLLTDSCWNTDSHFKTIQNVFI